MGRFLSLAITALLCISCATAPKQGYIYGATPIHPEPWFRKLYDQASACVQNAGATIRKEGSYESIEWFMVESGAMGPIVGLWSWPNRIFIDRGYMTHPWVLRHEMLHHLLGANFLQDSHTEADFAGCVDAPFDIELR